MLYLRKIIRTTDLKVLLFILGLFRSSFFIGQNEIKVWHIDPNLTFQDFKGKPLEEHEIVALSYLAISLLKLANGEYVVSAEFNTKRSWINSSKSNTDILNHEQGHFDLCEIYCRKLRKELFKAQKHNWTMDRVSRVYNRLQRKHFRRQRCYDSQTNFHKNQNGQKKWDAKIQFKLEKYAEWKYF